jgi:glycosyltransferase involved in cell wall biosynthesis
MVSILLPTMGRPERAVGSIEQIRATTQGHDIEIICPVDADQTTARALEGLGGVRVDYRDRPQGCSAAWNRALALSRGDMIVFAADDLQWGEGWLDEALTVMDGLGLDGGLVGFNDGHWNGWELATHYLMSRRFIIDVLGGVIAWDFYRHSFNDLEINERAKASGRFAWAEHAHVRHEHWLFGDRDQDDTDRATLAEHGASQAIYEQRRAAGFPSDYTPVITE